MFIGYPPVLHTWAERPFTGSPPQGDCGGDVEGGGSGKRRARFTPAVSNTVRPAPEGGSAESVCARQAGTEYQMKPPTLSRPISADRPMGYAAWVSVGTLTSTSRTSPYFSMNFSLP